MLSSFCLLPVVGCLLVMQRNVRKREPMDEFSRLIHFISLPFFLTLPLLFTTIPTPSSPLPAPGASSLPCHHSLSLPRSSSHHLVSLPCFFSQDLVFKNCMSVPGSCESFTSARWALLQVCPHVLYKDMFNALFLKLLNLQHYGELPFSLLTRNGGKNREEG